MCFILNPYMWEVETKYQQGSSVLLTAPSPFNPVLLLRLKDVYLDGIRLTHQIACVFYVVKC